MCLTVITDQICIIVFIFFIYRYVYRNLDTIDCHQFSPDEIDELLQGAKFYDVGCLVNRIVNFLNQNLVQEIQPKSLFWLLDHYFLNRTNDATAATKWLSCVENLSSQTMTVEELNGAESLSYLEKDCLDSLLNSAQFNWTVEQKFQLVCAWTRRHLDIHGIPFNSHNIALFLGHTINQIGINSLGCRSFMNTVYNSNFLTRAKCIEFLTYIMGRRAGTTIVDHQPQPIIATFQRFDPTHILSGKRYGPRQDRPIRQRRRRRSRPPRRDVQTSQQNREEGRRAAESRDMEAIWEREPDRPQLDRIGIPLPVNIETLRITDRDDHADSLSFMCSHDALLNKIEIFGSDGRRDGHYRIELKIVEESNTQNAVYEEMYELDTDGVRKTYPLTILQPINITKNMVYTIYMVMIGPTSYFGIYGNVEVKPVDAGNMVVLFIPNEIGCNGTNNFMGQFASITLEKIRALPSRN